MGLTLEGGARKEEGKPGGGYGWLVRWEIRGSGEHGRDITRLENDLLARVKEGHRGDNMNTSVGVGGHKG